ncbi:sulfur oxidation c-type cytochrome SoxX, partial [Halomonas litopenaei]|nr:sulfur oxidation c-type cytochrome SoxX [Halomonas litopenaei]
MKQILSAGVAIAIATVGFAEGMMPDDVVYSEYGEVEASLSGQPGDAAAGLE